MRAPTTAQNAVLAAGVQSDFIRVSIKDAGGTYRDVSTYPAYNALHEISWRGSVDEPHVSGVLVLKREFYGLSVAPLMATSPVNTGFVPGGAYAPFVADNRAIKIEVAVVAAGTKPTSSDWMTVFRGLTDKIDAGNGTFLTINFMGAFSRLSKQFIDIEYVYSFAAVAGTAVRLRVWEPQIGVTLNTDYLLPATRGVNDSGFNRFFKCSQTGVTGTVEPTWTTLNNQVDGTAKWDYVGATTVAGNPVEQIMQNILDDNLGTGDVSVALLVPVSPGWAIRQFQQDRTYTLDALKKLSSSIGWDLREVWNAPDSDFRLKFYSPSRTSPAVNYTFAKREYMDVRELSIDPSMIRNKIRVYYTDRSTLMPDGTPSRFGVQVQDNTSITNHGEYIMELHEDSNDQIDGSTEATALANAALSDCAEPTAQMSVVLSRGFPFVELNDYYTFKADNLHFSADQSLAVTAFEHRLSPGKRLQTTLTLRGKPTIGAGVFISRSVHPSHKQTERPHKEKHFQGGKTASPSSYGVKPGGARVSLDLDLDKNALVEEYEHHLYPTASSALSSSTMATVSKDRNIEFGHLNPGDLTYHRMVPRTRNGNKIIRGQPTAEQSFVAGWVEPRFLNPQTVLQPMPPNGSFEGRRSGAGLDVIPDLWFMVTGTWATDARMASADSYDGVNAVELRSTAVAVKIRSSFFPVTAGYRYLLEAFIKKVGTPTATADLAVEWYDRSQTIISTDTLGVALAGIGAGWTRAPMFKQAPATAAFAKVFVAKHDNGTFAFYVDAVSLQPQDRPIAMFTRTANQAIVNATPTVVDFATSVLDTHSAVTTGAAWKFAVPTGKAGRYAVSAAVMFDFAADNAAVVTELHVDKNGARVWNFSRDSMNPANNYKQLHGCVVLDLAEADYIQIVCYQAAGGNRNIASVNPADYNFVQIIRIDPA